MTTMTTMTAMMDKTKPTPRRRGVGKKPRMVTIGLRIPPEIANYYRAIPNYTRVLRQLVIDAAKGQAKEASNGED